MEGFEQRIRARIEELKGIREQAMAQINAAAGAIGELEALLQPAKEMDKPVENPLGDPE